MHRGSQFLSFWTIIFFVLLVIDSEMNVKYAVVVCYYSPAKTNVEQEAHVHLSLFDWIQKI